MRIWFIVLLSTVTFLSFGSQQDSVKIKYIDSLNKAYIKLHKLNLPKADSIINIAYTLSSEINYVKGLAISLNNLGSTHEEYGNNKKALELYLASLKIFENNPELQKLRTFSELCVGLGYIFRDEKEYKKSLNYLYKGASACREIKDEAMLSLIYQAIASVYSHLNNRDSVLHYYNSAMEYFIKKNNTMMQGYIKNGLGEFYFNAGEYKTALDQFLTGFVHIKKWKMTPYYSLFYHNIAKVYYKQSQFKLAINYSDSSILFSKLNKQLKNTPDDYLLKAKCFKELSNLDSVNFYYHQAVNLKDSLYGEKYKEELAKAETNLEVYKQESIKQLLEKDKDIAMLYRNLAIAAAVVLGAIVAFLLLTQKLKVQGKVKAQLENEVLVRTNKIQIQKQELDQTNLKLKLSLNRSKVDPHFVFNVLNSIQHVVLQKKPTEAQDHLAKLSRLMRYVLEKSSLDLVLLKDELKMLEQYILLEQLRLDYKFQFEIGGKFPNDIMIPAMLIQPYIENAIIHGIAPSRAENLKLSIRINADSEYLTILVQDNGVGITKKEKTSDHNSIGSSLGKERLEILSTLSDRPFELDITNLDALGQTGTRVTVKMPLQITSNA